MRRGFWLNPGPMLLALFIDSWFNSVHTARAEPQASLTPFIFWIYVSWVFFVTAALSSLMLNVEVRWWWPLGGWILVSLLTAVYAHVRFRTRVPR
jgi:hypothetical protein